MPAEALGAIVCSLIVWLGLGTLIGAVFLRAAIALYNKVAGEDYRSRVKEPELGRAMGITFATTLVNLVSGFAVGFVLGAAGIATGQDQRTVTLLAQAISIPFGFLVMSAMLSAMLPTTFGRAALITLFFYLIAIAVAIFIGVLVFTLFAGMLGR